MSSAKTYLLGAVSVLAAFLVGALVSGLLVKGHFKAILGTFKPDTIQVTKWDTIRVDKPVFVASKPIRDSFPIYLHDTAYVVRADTLYLPKEQKEYRDSTYRAWVSGVSPSLDSIHVYQKTVTQTISVPVVKKRKLNFGVQAGFGVVQPIAEPHSPRLGYYLGGGVQWNF